MNYQQEVRYVLPTYVLFPWEALAFHLGDRLAEAAGLPPNSLRVDVFRCHMHDTRIPLLVSDRQYLRPHVWWGNLGRNGQAGQQSTSDARVKRGCMLTV